MPFYFRKQFFQYLLKLFNLNKIINIIIIWTSYLISRLLRIYFFKGYPYVISVEPSSLCNLKCPQCPVGLNTLSRQQKNLNINDYQNIIDSISEFSIIVQLFFQGEPFINNDIIKMIDYAYQKGNFTVISTNGYRLENYNFAEKVVQSKLGKLIISMDGATDETYKIYRQNGSYSKLLIGIENVIKAKKKFNKATPIIDLQFIVMKHNEHEIDKIKALGKQFGVDIISIKSAQIEDFNNSENFLPSNSKFRRYKIVDGKYLLKGNFSGYCKKIWIASVITANADVIPCCFDKNANFKMESLNSLSFKNIWNSKKYRNFRNQVRDNRQNFTMCKNCTEGLKIFW